MLANPSPQELADKWRCHPRTILRMRAQGIDCTDALAVGEYLARLKNPSPGMLESVLDSLLTESDRDEINLSIQ